MAEVRLRTLRVVVYLIGLAFLCAIILRWISLERWHAAALRPDTQPTLEDHTLPTPTATRTPIITGKPDLARIFNGIMLRSEVESTSGADATTERVDPQSYVADFKLKVRVPAPNRTIDELGKVNPSLAKVLPGLSTMLTPDSVSPLFAQLYETKVRMLRENLNRLDLLLSRHNFFDCQTVLQLQHPESKRRALLLQADMDVDADGSDSDRVPAGHGVSPNFQPFTSFRWAKKTSEPNPYLPATQEKLKRYETEATAKATSADRKRELKGAMSLLRDEIGAMKKFSYLIGATDPFIVMPGSFAKGKDAMKVGDYAVVIYEDRIYPAIVGDIGPNDKVGEASLRIAKEISGASTPMIRPVNELKATYLVFPGTADTSWGPPDLEKLQTRCDALVKEIGGATVPLHHWENIIPPLPTPTPSPTPTPTPSATPSPSPTSTSTISPSTTASPSATFAFPTASASPTP